MPMPLDRGCLPNTSTRPAVSLCWPTIALSTVVLPQPLDPSSAYLHLSNVYVRITKYNVENTMQYTYDKTLEIRRILQSNISGASLHKAILCL